MPPVNAMDEALQEAVLAAERDETPVGAVVVWEGRIVSRAGNETRRGNDPTAHAEMLAIRRACSISICPLSQPRAELPSGACPATLPTACGG